MSWETSRDLYHHPPPLIREGPTTTRLSTDSSIISYIIIITIIAVVFIQWTAYHCVRCWKPDCCLWSKKFPCPCPCCVGRLAHAPVSTMILSSRGTGGSCQGVEQIFTRSTFHGANRLLLPPANFRRWLDSVRTCLWAAITAGARLARESIGTGTASWAPEALISLTQTESIRGLEMRLFFLFWTYNVKRQGQADGKWIAAGGILPFLGVSPGDGISFCMGKIVRYYIDLLQNGGWIESSSGRCLRNEQEGEGYTNRGRITTIQLQSMEKKIESDWKWRQWRREWLRTVESEWKSSSSIIYLCVCWFIESESDFDSV